MTENTKSPWGVLTGIRPSKIATKLLLGGMSADDTVKYFVREYGADEKKARLAAEVAQVELPIRKNMSESGVSIYIGIPFCPTRCLYCSFVTCGTKQAARLTDKYVEALKCEISYVSDIVSENGNTVETVYILSLIHI